MGPRGAACPRMCARALCIHCTRYAFLGAATARRLLRSLVPSAMKRTQSRCPRAQGMTRRVITGSPGRAVRAHAAQIRVAIAVPNRSTMGPAARARSGARGIGEDSYSASNRSANVVRTYDPRPGPSGHSSLIVERTKCSVGGSTVACVPVSRRGSNVRTHKPTAKRAGRRTPTRTRQEHPPCSESTGKQVCECAIV
jgi:hypothetical protein